MHLLNPDDYCTYYPHSSQDRRNPPNGWAQGRDLLVVRDGDRMNEHPHREVHPGDLLYGLRLGGAFSTANVALHKEGYRSVPSDRGLVWSSHLAVLERVTFVTDLQVGDILVVSAKDEDRRGEHPYLWLVRESTTTTVPDPFGDLLHDTDGPLVTVAPVERGETLRADLDRTSRVALILDEYHYWRAPLLSAPTTEREEVTTVTETTETLTIDGTTDEVLSVSDLRTQIAQKDTTIAELEDAVQRLTAARDAAQDRHCREVQDVIGQALLSAADEHDFCSVYDDVVNEINRSLTYPLPLRSSEWDVRVSVTASPQMTMSRDGVEAEVSLGVSFSVSGSVTAVSEDEAAEAVDADWVLEQYFDNIDVESDEVEVSLDNVAEFRRWLDANLTSYDIDVIDVDECERSE